MFGQVHGDVAEFVVFTETDRERCPMSLRETVTFCLAEDDLAHGCGDEAAQHLERTVLTLLARQPWNEVVDADLAQRFEGLSADALRLALGRAERRLAENPAVGRVLASVAARLVA